MVAPSLSVVDTLRLPLEINVHGMPGQPAAYLTSRIVTANTLEQLATGNAEVDYVLAPMKDARCRPGESPLVCALPQQVPWTSIGQRLSHTSVTVEVPTCWVTQ